MVAARIPGPLQTAPNKNRRGDWTDRAGAGLEPWCGGAGAWNRRAAVVVCALFQASRAVQAQQSAWAAPTCPGSTSASAGRCERRSFLSRHLSPVLCCNLALRSHGWIDGWMEMEMEMGVLVFLRWPVGRSLKEGGNGGGRWATRFHCSWQRNPAIRKSVERGSGFPAALLSSDRNAVVLRNNVKVHSG